MQLLFYISALVAIIATFMVITRKNAVHALLYLIVSLLAIAVIFYLIGAPFVAALEVIIYAGAIMVLFIFVVMMLNLGSNSEEQEAKWMTPKIWIVPSLLTAILLIEFLLLVGRPQFAHNLIEPVLPKEVGTSLFTDYLIGVEMAGMLLMAGVIGAYHLGKKKRKSMHRYLQETEES